MSHRSVKFRAVTFQYDGQDVPIIDRLSLQFSRGWTGVVGANGAGKSTLLKLATGSLAPTSGAVDSPGMVAYCPQRTDDCPVDFESFLTAHDRPSRLLMGRLRIEEDWCQRWETLSHGERKRVQIGVALWHMPALLAIDEPTNHLDRIARQWLEDALRAYQGIGLLVSHDRDLLDSLCHQCLFLDPPTAELRPGGVTQGREQADRERTYQRDQLGQAQGARDKLQRETNRHRQAASRADRQRSKRGLSAKDRDAREKINRARVSGKDGLAGKRKRQLEGRLRQAEEHEKHWAAKTKKRKQLGISIPEVVLQRATLLRVPAGTLPITDRRSLAHPELVVCPADRIALLGPNGAGKSTLIRFLLQSLEDGMDGVTYLPQEITAADSARTLQQARSLTGDALGRVMTLVDRLGSEPGPLLDSQLPSPGEVRKLMLATGIAQGASFLILDEPTNHLDLPSIECVESALRDSPCGLLVVSHDDRFLGRLTRTRWTLAIDAAANTQLTIQLGVEQG